MKHVIRKLTVVVLILIVSGLVGYKLAKGPSSEEKISELFQEKIEYKFYSYATTIVGKQRMQVAKLNEVEVFERTSKLKAFWIELPDIVVKATVPVEYGFFVDLGQGWKFQMNDDEIIVDVPALTNSTPAVDISKLKFDVVKGSFFRSETKSLDALQKELMGMLIDKSIEHRETVKEQARTSIEQFVKGWLSQAIGGLPSQKVRVRFPGELENKNN